MTKYTVREHILYSSILAGVIVAFFMIGVPLVWWGVGLAYTLLGKWYFFLGMSF